MPRTVHEFLSVDMAHLPSCIKPWISILEKEIVSCAALNDSHAAPPTLALAILRAPGVRSLSSRAPSCGPAGVAGASSHVAGSVTFEMTVLELVIEEAMTADTRPAHNMQPQLDQSEQHL